MFKMSKCPKCEKVVQQARLEHTDVSDGQMVIKAFSASCPSCYTILGIITDPRPQDTILGQIARAVGLR